MSDRNQEGVMEKQKNSSDIIRKYGIILILIALFIVSAFISKNFLKPQNLINIMNVNCNNKLDTLC